MRSNSGLMTADALLALAMPDARTELLRGRLVVREPAGARHGLVAARVLAVIAAYLERARLESGDQAARGDVLAAETGFVLGRDPDTVRAPDVGYVTREKLANVPPRGFVPFAPDLAVEVLSSDDSRGAVVEKVAAWLQAGASLVWVVDPHRRLVHVHRSGGGDAELGADDTLDGGELLPGFRARISDLLR